MFRMLCPYNEFHCLKLAMPMPMPVVPYQNMKPIVEEDEPIRRLKGVIY